MKVRLFEKWDRHLEEALFALPEAEICPHPLYATLCSMPGRSKKVFALFEDKGCPVVMACFRNDGDEWVPITHYLVPGFLFPAREEFLIPTLPALGVRLRIAWWRLGTEPPQVPWISGLRSFPTFGMDMGEDFEAFWHEGGQWKNIRKYRNRCESLYLTENEPGMVEQTVRNWELRWRPEGSSGMPDIEERVMIANYLEKAGRCFALALKDKDEVAASATLLAHENTAVAYVNYRNHKYDWNGAMNRLIDLVFHWVREKGFAAIDLGGGLDYKEKWAPENGTRWEFVASPAGTSLEKRLLGIGKATWERLTGPFSG